MKRLANLLFAICLAFSAYAQSEHYIYVYDRTGWPTTALYAWGTSELYGRWPGALPVDTITIDNVVCKKFAFNGQDGRDYSLIFNNNNNGVQLADFAAIGGRDYTLTITTAGVSVGIDTTEVVEPEPLPTNDYVVYQANEKIFATNNAFTAIENRLDEISQLGVNVLWLMPIHPVGQKNSVNSPYCVKDFKGVNPNFGTEEDLIRLVNNAHDHGMKVILDWVANHSALDNPWITEHPEWYGTATGDEKNWNDVKPFNFDDANMRDAMIDAMTYWIRQADIDGFRCDYAQGCPDDFWKQATDSIRALKPEAIMLAESSRTQLFQNGFDWMYSWSYLSAIQNLYSGKRSLDQLYSSSDGEMGSTPVDRERLRYITNHDACSEKANSDLYTNANGMLSAACLTYFLEGVPLIYSSQEIGYLNKINFCTTSSGSVKMNWNSNPECLAATKKLMRAYHLSLPLRGGERTLYKDNAKVACFTFANEAGTLLVIANTTNQQQTLNLPTSLAGHTMQNLLTDHMELLPTSLSLDPFAYYVMAETEEPLIEASICETEAHSYGHKLLQGGQIVIEKDGQLYNLLGTRITK